MGEVSKPAPEAGGEFDTSDQLVKDILSKSLDLEQAKLLCLEAKAQETAFGFNLSRANGGIDILLQDSRYLLYTTSFGFPQLYDRLKASNLPHFEIVDSNIDQSIAAVKIPFDARPMDSVVYKEQGFVQGYIGAFEKMAQLGEYLAKLYKAIGALPLNLKLVNLAFLNQDKNFIRLVPPIEASPQVNIKDVSNSIQEDLVRIDPRTPHETQVDKLIKSFKLELERHD
ncbi:hypothetical protein HY389_02435 [Candidatus Daviesbacteria bacterium]|nr:hypothetical protein [Candidatus Daviesbacteria bacterium]